MLHSSKITALTSDNIPIAERMIFAPQLDIVEISKNPSASIDLRLGGWFVYPRVTKQHILDVFESRELDVQSSIPTSKHYVPFGDKFVLHPRSFVLAATLEWIRLPNAFGGYVSGKSSWGRRGLVIETAPGVHPGFSGCLTLELANVGEIPIALRPGMKICQLFIHRVESDVKQASRSGFDGRRQPVLGEIKMDNFTKNLLAVRGA